jgi:hypothetical protein
MELLGPPAETQDRREHKLLPPPSPVALLLPLAPLRLVLAPLLGGTDPLCSGSLKAKAAHLQWTRSFSVFLICIIVFRSFKKTMNATRQLVVECDRDPAEVVGCVPCRRRLRFPRRCGDGEDTRAAALELRLPNTWACWVDLHNATLRFALACVRLAFTILAAAGSGTAQLGSNCA